MQSRRLPRRWSALALVVPLLYGLAAGCAPGTAAGAEPGADGAGRLDVAASFYPLQFVAQRVGGEPVRVRSLTKPGAEPHDAELTPRDVAALSRADAVLYLKGSQPAVDRPVEANGLPVCV